MQDIQKQELISALADGQVDGEHFAAAVAAACADDASLRRWHEYHLIGDVLRSGDRANCRTSASVVERVRMELAREPAGALVSPDVRVMPVATQAANDNVFRWKVVAGFATAASVALVGWNFVAGPASPQLTGVELASARSAASAQPVMLRDPRLDELLAAHRQYAGATALHTPAVFLRNATFESPAR